MHNKSVSYISLNNFGFVFIFDTYILDKYILDLFFRIPRIK